ncbi:UDP-glycosyltransferase 72B3 [Spatholobus suberectus]|nr:UDP-glycosyltransferase 72B3 [Spatholobus suberectus]
MEDQHSLTYSQQELPPVVTMMPSPGMGHLLPMIEFAKRLSRHHNLPVTFLIPTYAPPSNAQTTLLSSLPRFISHTFLSPATLSDLPPNTQIDTLISLAVLRSLPSLRHSLLSLSAVHRVAALVVDIFGTDAFDLARELNAPLTSSSLLVPCFCPSPCTCLA